MARFRINSKYDEPVQELQCSYCPNKFKGRNNAHSQELLDAHIARKHSKGSTEF